MLGSITNALIPHHCCSCGAIGAVLCEYCKYDIISESFGRCIVCLGPAAPVSHLCGSCNEPYTRAWCVGERGEALKIAINLYKYKSARAAAAPLIDLLDHTVPYLPPATRVVAVPTITSHVRVRGYDHMKLIVKQFARRRGLHVEQALRRVGTVRQQGASRQQRLTQAKSAFQCDPVAPVPHLLVDDVCTTGATLHYAAKALRDAGASEVYVAVLSRQTLEKSVG